jgi:hypothetical protein
LFVGDLSYADNYPNHDNVRWDTWGRFVERSVAYQPWIWTAGNHEIDFAPEIVSISHHSLSSNEECYVLTFLKYVKGNRRWYLLYSYFLRVEMLHLTPFG